MEEDNNEEEAVDPEQAEDGGDEDGDGEDISVVEPPIDVCEEARQQIKEMKLQLRRLEHPSAVSTREITMDPADDPYQKRQNYLNLVSSVNQALSGPTLANHISRELGHRKTEDDEDEDAPTRGLSGIHAELDRLNEGLQYWHNLYDGGQYKGLIHPNEFPSPLRNPVKYRRLSEEFKKAQTPAPLPPMPKAKPMIMTAPSSPNYKAQPPQQGPLTEAESRRLSTVEALQPSDAQSAAEASPQTPPPPLRESLDVFHPEEPEELDAGFLCRLTQDTSLLDEAGIAANKMEDIPRGTVIEIEAVEVIDGKPYAKLIQPNEGWIPCYDENLKPNLPKAVLLAGQPAQILVKGPDEGPTGNDVRIRIMQRK